MKTLWHVYPLTTRKGNYVNLNVATKAIYNVW